MTSVAALAIPLLSSARTPPLPLWACELRLSGFVIAEEDDTDERLPFFALQEQFCTICHRLSTVFSSQFSVDKSALTKDAKLEAAKVEIPCPPPIYL